MEIESVSGCLHNYRYYLPIHLSTYLSIYLSLYIYILYIIMYITHHIYIYIYLATDEEPSFLYGIAKP